MIASVSGSDRSIRVPRPGSLCTRMEPRSESTSRLTTSMPTPRPETSVTFVAVEKPGRKISSKISLLGELGIGGNQASFPGLAEDGGGVQAGAVVDDGNDDVGPLVGGRQRDGAHRRLA